MSWTLFFPPADRPTELATRLLWDQLELKAPQERSDEETEAEPTESEVASPVGLMHPYSSILDFAYSRSPVVFLLRRSDSWNFAGLYFNQS